MTCNNCGNESHCGEVLKDDVNGMSVVECKKCNCSDCKEYSDLDEDAFNGE